MTNRPHKATPELTHIKDLTPDPENRRQHNPRNLGMVSDALRRVGAARSIVIDEDGTVLAGNGVLEAAAEAGIHTVQIVEADGSSLVAVRRRGLSPEQKRDLAISDNRTAELAEWNAEQLAADVEAGLDLAPWFSETELAGVLGRPPVRDGLTDPDAAPPLRATEIEPGDLFALGRHRLICGDATDAATVAQVFGAERAVLAFTSPPYADQRSYTGDSDLSPERLARFLAAARDRVDVFAVNLGIVRRGGFVLRYWDAYLTAAAACGLGLLSWNVWSREGGSMSVGQVTAMFPIQHEWILVFGRAPVHLRPTIANVTGGDLTTPTDRGQDGRVVVKRPVTKRSHREIGTIVTVQAVDNNADHPAQFPADLARLYLEAFTGAVYDPFVGSGTTLIAAEQLERACFAVEIVPSYCQVTIDRWEAFTGQRAVKVGEAVRA